MRLLFLAIFLDLEMLKFWPVKYISQVCQLYFFFGNVLNFGQCLYLSVFSKQWKFLLLALVKYMLYSHFTQNCIFCIFWRLKILVLWRKIVENLLIFVYLFCPKNDAIDFTKTFITQEWFVVESCPTPRWIAFLMLYRLVYNIRSNSNELIVAWSAYWYVVFFLSLVLRKIR